MLTTMQEKSWKSDSFLGFYSDRKSTLYFAFSRISINNRLFLLLGDPQIGCDPQTEFDCGGDGKMCIPLERVCNRKNDCGNWADEPKSLCGLNECSEGLEVGGGCDQQCIDLPIGYKCACKQGYHLVGNATCKGQQIFWINKKKIRKTFTLILINKQWVEREGCIS